MGRISETEVLAAIRSVSKKIGGDVLNQRQFLARSKITISDVLRYFPKWSDACQSAGVQSDRSRDRVPDEKPLSDWGQVARKLGSIPSLTAYKVNGKFSRTVFNRFGLWKDVPNAFIKFAENSDDWEDVVEIVKQASSNPKKKKAALGTKTNKGSVGKHWHEKLDTRPVYGDPINFRGLRHEPVNEQGVVFLFGMVAKDIGYRVEAIQNGYPDCEAKRKVSPGQWQTVRIEFEYESRSFLVHGHDPEKCDVIICWIHNWPECPENLEVLVLSEEIEKLPS